jgi:hypothetical protein
MFIFISGSLIRWAVNGGRSRRCPNTAVQRSGAGNPPPAVPVRPPLATSESEALCRRALFPTAVLDFVLFLIFTISIALHLVHVEHDSSDIPGLTCTIDTGLVRACVTCSMDSVSRTDCQHLFANAWLGSFGKALWVLMALVWITNIIASLIVGAVCSYLGRVDLPLDPERVLFLANIHLALQITLDAAGTALLICAYLILGAVDGTSDGPPVGAGGWMFGAGVGLSMLHYWCYAKLRSASVELRRSREAEAESGDSAEQPLVAMNSGSSSTNNNTTTAAAPQQTPRRVVDAYVVEATPQHGHPATATYAQPHYAPPYADPYTGGHYAPAAVGVPHHHHQQQQQFQYATAAPVAHASSTPRVYHAQPLYAMPVHDDASARRGAHDVA